MQITISPSRERLEQVLDIYDEFRSLLKLIRSGDLSQDQQKVLLQDIKGRIKGND